MYKLFISLVMLILFSTSVFAFEGYSHLSTESDNREHVKTLETKDWSGSTKEATKTKETVVKSTKQTPKGYEENYKKTTSTTEERKVTRTTPFRSYELSREQSWRNRPAFNAQMYRHQDTHERYADPHYYAPMPSSSGGYTWRW